jgi:hypothetical protein
VLGKEAGKDNHAEAKCGKKGSGLDVDSHDLFSWIVEFIFHAIAKVTSPWARSLQYAVGFGWSPRHRQFVHMQPPLGFPRVSKLISAPGPSDLLLGVKH